MTQFRENILTDYGNVEVVIEDSGIASLTFNDYDLTYRPEVVKKGSGPIGIVCSPIGGEGFRSFYVDQGGKIQDDGELLTLADLDEVINSVEACKEALYPKDALDLGIESLLASLRRASESYTNVTLSDELAREIDEIINGK